MLFDDTKREEVIEKVKNKLIMHRKFYVYREEFPLILAYALTVHKCQGLSLKCAIMDLSTNVFSPGMAYVALSHVKTLSGVHLTKFEPDSIMVDHQSIKEINRLRGSFRSSCVLLILIGIDCYSGSRELQSSIAKTRDGTTSLQPIKTFCRW